MNELSDRLRSSWSDLSNHAYYVQVDVTQYKTAYIKCKLDSLVTSRYACGIVVGDSTKSYLELSSVTAYERPLSESELNIEKLFEIDISSLVGQKYFGIAAYGKNSGTTSAEIYEWWLE